jgi:hypothetical protein
MLVDSDQKVIGLNADELDGRNWTAFAGSNHNHDSSYLGVNAKAANSDKLDGRNWTFFAPAADGVPSGAVMFFNATTCPSGWSEYTKARGRTMVGLTFNGTLGAKNGSALADKGDLAMTSAGSHNHAWSTYSGVSAKSWKTYSFSGIDLLVDWSSTGMDSEGSGFYPLAPHPDHNSANRTYYTSLQTAHTHSVDLPYVQLLACEKD